MTATRILILTFSLLIASCGSLQGIQDTAENIAAEVQESVNTVAEVRIPIGETIEVTKDGVDIGNVNIQPTRFRPNINGVDYPTYYGVTIIYRF